MDPDVCSISGFFGACIEEEAEKGSHKFGFIRQASARFFRSIKQAHRNISGSLSSVLSRQSTETENSSQSKKSNNVRKARSRPHSIAFGEEFKVSNIPTSIGKSSFVFNLLFTCWYNIIFFNNNLSIKLISVVWYRCWTNIQLSYPL